MFPQLPCLKKYFETIEGLDDKHINDQQEEFRLNNGATGQIGDATKEANNLAGFTGGLLVSELARLASNLSLTGRQHINDLIRRACDLDKYGYLAPLLGGMFLRCEDENNGIENGFAFSALQDERMQMINGLAWSFVSDTIHAVIPAFSIKDDTFEHTLEYPATSAGNDIFLWLGVTTASPILIAGYITAATRNINIEIWNSSTKVAHYVWNSLAVITENDLQWSFPMTGSGISIRVKQRTDTSVDFSTVGFTAPDILVTDDAIVDATFVDVYMGTSNTGASPFAGLISYFKINNETWIAQGGGVVHSVESGILATVSSPIDATFNAGRMDLGKYEIERRDANSGVMINTITDGITVADSDSCVDPTVGFVKFRNLDASVATTRQLIHNVPLTLWIRIEIDDEYNIRAGSETFKNSGIFMIDRDSIHMYWDATNVTLDVYRSGNVMPRGATIGIPSLRFTDTKGTDFAGGTLLSFLRRTSDEYLGTLSKIETGDTSTLFTWAGESTTESREGVAITNNGFTRVHFPKLNSGLDQYGETIDFEKVPITGFELDGTIDASPALAFATATMLADIDGMSSFIDDQTDGYLCTLFVMTQELTDTDVPMAYLESVRRAVNRPLTDILLGIGNPFLDVLSTDWTIIDTGADGTFAGLNGEASLLAGAVNTASGDGLNKGSLSVTSGREYQMTVYSFRPTGAQLTFGVASFENGFTGVQFALRGSGNGGADALTTAPTEFKSAQVAATSTVGTTLIKLLPGTTSTVDTIIFRIVKFFDTTWD